MHKHIVVNQTQTPEQSDLPKFHETKLWTADAPRGQAWLCGECGHWATLGGNAAYHAMKEKHGAPELWTLPAGTETVDPSWVPPAPEAKPLLDFGDEPEPEPVTADDITPVTATAVLMRATDALKLVLDVAAAAISMLEQRGCRRETEVLRRALDNARQL